MAPMTMPADSSPMSTGLRVPAAARLRKVPMATSTAARPTKLCRAATSCGMAVIWMRRARMVPMTAPPATPAMMKP